MKKSCSFFFAVFVSCIAPEFANAHTEEALQTTEPQKKEYSGEFRTTNSPSMTESLGNKHLGTVRFTDNRFILNDAYGNRLMDIDAGCQRNPKASQDLLLPEKCHAAGGVIIPLTQTVRFKQLFNRSWVDSNYGTDYMALGSYLSGTSERFDWKFGFETDSKETSVKYGMGEFRNGAVRFIGGLSLTETHAMTASGQSSKKNEMRYGGGLVWTPPDYWNHQVMGGLVDGLDTKKRSTYILGVGKCTNNKSSGLDPNYIVLYRNRAESEYLLGILTLSGKALQCKTNESIFSAFFEGGLGPVRIVNNRNFDTLGVGGSYRTQEYGKLALAVSAGRTHITPLITRNFADASLYYTFDNTSESSLFDRYLGVGYSGGDDVFLNLTGFQPALGIKYTDSARVNAGTKFRLFEQTMRFELVPQVNLHTKHLAGTFEFSIYF